MRYGHIEQKNEPVKVVLDTNILVSAAISQRSYPWMIFELFLAGDIVHYVSPETLAEAKGVFARPFLASCDHSVLAQVLARSVQVVPVERITACSDANDNMFLECAVAADAAFIVTGDDALLAMRYYRSIRILSAERFVKRERGHG